MCVWGGGGGGGECKKIEIIIQSFGYFPKYKGESFQNYSWIQDFEESQPQNAELGRL